jgi:hypothetical protein
VAGASAAYSVDVLRGVGLLATAPVPRSRPTFVVCYLHPQFPGQNVEVHLLIAIPQAGVTLTQCAAITLERALELAQHRSNNPPLGIRQFHLFFSWSEWGDESMLGKARAVFMSRDDSWIRLSDLLRTTRSTSVPSDETR